MLLLPPQIWGDCHVAKASVVSQGVLGSSRSFYLSPNESVGEFCGRLSNLQRSQACQSLSNGRGGTPVCLKSSGAFLNRPVSTVRRSISPSDSISASVVPNAVWLIGSKSIPARVMRSSSHDALCLRYCHCRVRCRIYFRRSGWTLG